MATFPARPWLDTGRVSMRAVVADGQLAEASTCLHRYGARIDGSGPRLVGPVTCHVQLGGLEGEGPPRAARRSAPGARLHLDAMLGPGGPELGGLLLTPFVSEPALHRTMQTLAGGGVRVVDPHTWCVSDPDGLLGRIALELDPGGLFNPGKLARPLSR